MKKLLLILMMLLLPWQAYAAAERNITHVLGGAGHGPEAVAKHMAEHADHILHHHDDHDDDDDDADGSTTHVDDSQKSFQHLADFEQGCSMNIIASVAQEPDMPVAMRVAPGVKPDGYSNRTTIPPLPPPRAFA